MYDRTSYNSQIFSQNINMEHELYQTVVLSTKLFNGL